MYLQELVEVVIGLIFAWLVLSIATMQVQEWIATYLGWRAKDMEKAIRNMLGDSAWTEQLYAHPVVKALGEKTGIKPSYIPANQFAVALFDLVTTAGTDASEIQRALYTARKKVRDFPNNLPELWSYLVNGLLNSSGNFFAAMTNFLANAEIKTKDTRYNELTKLAQEAVSSSQKMTLFLKEFLGDVNCTRDSEGTIIREKILGFTAAELMVQFPELKTLLYKIYHKARTIDPTISNITKEQFVNYSVEEIDEAISKIKPIIDNSTPKIIEAMGFDNQNLAQNALARIENGLGTLVESNPTLHRALDSFTAGIQDINKNLNQGGDKAIQEITEKERHLAIIRKDAENWFDEVMARTQGWYKRKAQVWAFFISLVAALIMNVDSVDITIRLWREPALRQATAGYVAKWAEQADPSALQNQDIQKLNQELKTLQVPIGWSLVQYTGTRECAIPAKPDQTVGFYMPFSNHTCLEITNPPRNTSEMFLKFIGILVSALAAMQGAPFWFDILKKVVNVRGAGANPVEEPKAIAKRREDENSDR